MSIITQPPLDAEADKIPIAADDDGEHVPYVAARQESRRAHARRDRARHRARARLRALQRLPRAQGGADRQRIDSDLGALDHDLQIHLEVVRREARDDSAEQHGADDGIRGRVGGRGNRLHAPRPPPPRLQSAVDEGRGRRGRGRTARRLPHDPAAQRADREGAKDAQVSRGNGGGRGADRRRGARRAGAHRVPRLRTRGALQVPRERAAPLAGGAALRLPAHRTERAGSSCSARSARRSAPSSPASATSSGRGSPAFCSRAAASRTSC